MARDLRPRPPSRGRNAGGARDRGRGLPAGARRLRHRRLGAAAAGAAAATLWGLAEPLDQRLVRCDYSDIALLGKAATRGAHWRAAGFALHAVNGAVFGLVYDALGRRLPVALALGEHVALYPLTYFVDRYHPARGEPGVPPLLRNPRAFVQATWRHALFGTALGRLAG